MTDASSPRDPGRRRWLRTGVSGAVAATLAPVAALAAQRAATAAPAVPSASTPTPTPATPLRLDLNESSYGPSPQVPAAVQRALADAPRYVGAAKLQALQEQIARIEGVAPSQVVVGEILEALGQHLAITGNGGSFVYSVPGYGALVDAARPFGGHAVEVPLDAKLENDLPALEAAIADDTRALFIVNPHNPSGTISAADVFDGFLRRASARALVIVDEAYLDYQPDFERRTAVRHLREGRNVAVFRTLGKIHALAGLQLGYAVVPQALADALRARGVGGAHAQNQLSIAAAAASLADTGHIVRVRDQVAAERALWLDTLKSLGLRHAQPAGNFVFFDAGRPHAEVAAALLARGVKVARAFAPYDRWVRITIGVPAENVRAREAVVAVLGR